MLGGNFQINNFPGEETRGGETEDRLDFLTGATAGVSYNPFKHVRLNVGYEFGSRNSNLSVVNYSEHYVGSSIDLVL